MEENERADGVSGEPDAANTERLAQKPAADGNTGGEERRGFRNIFLLGLSSLFADASTEMVYPLIPLYLVSAFGATPALVGVIEGIAESLASLLKVVSGYLADRYKRKKPLAIAGYAMSLVYKAALLVATSWVGILAARVIDRFGKGMRTAPRDSLVSENAAYARQGAAFGLHKALDMAGSALGVAAAYGIMKATGGAVAYKNIFLLSMIPAVCGVVVLSFVRERREKRERRERLRLRAGWNALDARLKLFLLTAFLFNLGNSSNSFLLLRAYGAGYDAVSVILLYLAYNVTSSLLALPLGKLSDRIGRRNLLVVGYLTFSAVYLGFGLAKSGLTFALLFVLYGVYTAATSGVERALIARIAPPEWKGATLGLHGMLTGIALLPASVIAGLLWNGVSASAPFLFGAALAFLSAVSIALIFRGGGRAAD